MAVNIAVCTNYKIGGVKKVCKKLQSNPNFGHTFLNIARSYTKKM